MKPIIEVENISKQYRLGTIGTGTISHDLNRWWHRVRGMEDPYLKIGQVNNRSEKSSNDYVWSLRDISFNVDAGEVLGIIGKNGAGKSTLLKILSKVTAPTTGNIRMRGRVASLLEVGTGFHPELTGRENVFLNGAILGMTKKEIRSKFDEIVDFSGVEKYIDTPVKRYSSGMYVRLAFAVAAHLEPEILIVDEVLAVGDAEFQKKCLGKMKDVSVKDGRTVLFVSHNMAAVKQLCTKAIVLKNGTEVFEGNTNAGIDYYLHNNKTIKNAYVSELISAVEQTKITYIAFVDENKNVRNEFRFEEQIIIKLDFNVKKEHIGAMIGFKVKDKNENVIFSSEILIEQIADFEGKQKVEIIFPKSTLVPNSYSFNFAIHFPNIQIIELLEDIVTIDIIETGSGFHMYKNVDYGCVILDSKWLSKN